MKQPCIYIMANSKRGTMYIGVTSDLVNRAYQHKNEITGGFTQKYQLKNLVYFEPHETMERAILKEKKVKRWPREYKYNIIEETNPDWSDLYDTIL